MKNIVLLFITVIFFLFVTDMYGQKIGFSGYGAAGYRFIDRIRIIEANQEMYYEGKFQADIEIIKNIEAQLDFRGNSDDQQVILREFSASFSYLPRLKFRFGNIKKPFGYEQIESEEDLYSINRSYLQSTVSNLGYGGRSVGLMGYYKYSSKRKEFPHSYYFYIFKNNSSQNGFTGRYIYHFSDIAAGINYALLNTGGDFPLLSHAFAANIQLDKNDLFFDLELMFVQDPIEGIRRKVNKLDDKVFSAGARVVSAVGFDTGAEVIQEIEPLLLLSFFLPDTDEAAEHTVQTLVGVNFYFHKNVRLRLNGDILLSKNEFNDDYSTHDSRFILELQVRY